jgi:pimeloyl-ACP methyl ester carboxylesterase
MHPPTPFGAKLRIGASATVGVMAAMALYNLYRTKRSERQHPPRGRFVTIDGVQLHYLEAGSGPPVILLHGNVVSAEDFEVSRLFALLARRHRVVAFDRPGSMSGRARLESQCREPSTPFGEGRYSSGKCSHHSQCREVLLIVSWMDCLCGQVRFRAESQDGVIMVPAASGMEHRYRELMLPVAILAGTEDQVVNTEDQAVRLHRDVPHSTLRLIPDAGHMLHHAVPEKVAEVVDEASGPART